MKTLPLLSTFLLAFAFASASVSVSKARADGAVCPAPDLASLRRQLEDANPYPVSRSELAAGAATERVRNRTSVVSRMQDVYNRPYVSATNLPIDPRTVVPPASGAHVIDGHVISDGMRQYLSRDGGRFERLPELLSHRARRDITTFFPDEAAFQSAFKEVVIQGQGARLLRQNCLPATPGFCKARLRVGDMEINVHVCQNARGCRSGTRSMERGQVDTFYPVCGPDIFRMQPPNASEPQWRYLQTPCP